MPALHLDDVHAGYGARSVLEGVSLRAQPGTVTALLGRNGAGKSTLLRIAGGTLTPTRGRVLVGDTDLATRSPRARARLVASVGQEEAVEFPFTVRDLVGIGRYAHGGSVFRSAPADGEAVDAALATLALGDLADRPVPSLSGGERRRAFLARALAQEAAVLLLDEPSAHLDVGHEATLVRGIRACARERGTVVLLALHDLNLVGLVADRVVLLAHGRVRAEGTVRDVLKPAILSEAFGTELDVVPHPCGGAPLVVPRGAG